MNMKDALSKTTNFHIYMHWQNEHERCNKQDNWIPNLQSLAEWTWKKQWSRQLTLTSTNTTRMNMNDAMSKKTDPPHIETLAELTWKIQWAINWQQHLQALAEFTWNMLWARELTPTSTSTITMNMKEAMSKTIDSHIYKNLHNKHERRNKQDNWLPYLQTLAEWTRKKQWARQLTPTSTITGRMNTKETMSKTTESLMYQHW